MHHFNALRLWLLPSCVYLAFTVGVVQAQTCSKPAGTKGTVLSSGDIGKDTFADGSTATFICDTGYTFYNGSGSVSCRNGQWSTLTLTCERKNCGDPGQILNGDFDISQGTSFGDVAVAKCNTGYRIVGNDRRTCKDGGWSNNVPVCEAVTCTTPPVVENGYQVSSPQDSYEYGSVVQYRCKSGFTLSGQGSITCEEEDKFKPDPPKCIRVECPTPNIPNSIRTEGGSPPYGFQSFVSYQCKDGFELHGVSSLTCTIDSSWNHPYPECRVPGPGPKPTEPPHNNNKAIIGGVIGCLAVVGIVGFAIYWFTNNRSQRGYSGNVATK